MGDELDATSTGDEFNFDASLSDDTQQPQETQSSGGNPAWNSVLEVIPKEFHSQVTPHLQEWDRGVSTRFQKIREEATKPYADYQQFVDNKISPQELESAYQIWQQINTNPRAIYDSMTAMLQQMGLLETAQQNAELEEEEAPPVDPRIEALENQQRQLIETLQRAQQEQAQRQQIDAFAAQFDAQIKDEFAQIESKTGPIPEKIRIELLNRASMMTDQLNRPVSLIEAFNDLQSLRQTLLSSRPGQKAPQVVPSGGGYPATPPNVEALKTYEGRAAAVGEIVKRFAQDS